MNAGFYGNTSGNEARKSLPNLFRSGPEAASIDYFTVRVESTVIAPDILKVDTNRLDPGPSEWNFRDEVLRWFLHVE